jgi:hypothetical protein
VHLIGLIQAGHSQRIQDAGALPHRFGASFAARPFFSGTRR